MPAAEHDITIEQGATLRKSFVWKTAAGDPIDISGWSARMQVRTHYYATDAILSLTSDDAITLGGATGEIDIVVGADITTGLAFDEGVYDLELIDTSGAVTRLLKGRVNLDREVTR